LPMKNESLLALREVYQATINSKIKYPITKEKSKGADMHLI